MNKAKKKEIYEERKKALKGHFCWMCGSTEKLTLHHLKCSTKAGKIRKELGVILFKGECIPLCRGCHNLIEEGKVLKGKGTCGQRLQRLEKQYKKKILVIIDELIKEYRKPKDARAFEAVSALVDLKQKIQGV